VALPLMYTEASTRGFSLMNIARWMAEEPSKLAGFHERKGRIAAGYDADLVIFDTASEFVVNEAALHYRHPVSAYMGEKFRGVVKATYLRGLLIYQAGEFPGKPLGRELRHDGGKNATSESGQRNSVLHRR
jgi:allantoinase